MPQPSGQAKIRCKLLHISIIFNIGHNLLTDKIIA